MKPVTGFPGYTGHSGSAGQPGSTGSAGKTSEDRPQLPEHLEKMIPKIRLDEAQRSVVRELLAHYSDAFMSPDGVLGKTLIAKHRIDLTDDRPFRQQLRRAALAHQEVIDQEVHKILDMDITVIGDDINFVNAGAQHSYRTSSSSKGTLPVSTSYMHMPNEYLHETGHRMLVNCVHPRTHSSVEA